MCEPQAKDEEYGCSDSGLQAINEAIVDLEDDELMPYVRVVQKTRTSITYERME
jgi:hypothetical protein